MRTKTLNQIAQEAAKYAVETLDIERGIFAMGLCAACRFPTTPLMEDEDRTTLSQNF